jgi:hypothetical protein
VKTTPLSHGSLSKLTIVDVSPVDRGDFTCIASNAYGQDRATIQLTVQGSLKFNKPNRFYCAFIEFNAFLLFTNICGNYVSEVKEYWTPCK